MATIDMRDKNYVPYNPLTMNDYQDLTIDTAIYPGQGTIHGLMYTGLGLGEAGEVQGKIKKLYRDGGFDDPDKLIAVGEELGDLLWYVSATAAELGIPLDDIARGNLKKLQSRKERGVLGGSGDNR